MDDVYLSHRSDRVIETRNTGMKGKRDMMILLLKLEGREMW